MSATAGASGAPLCRGRERRSCSPAHRRGIFLWANGHGGARFPINVWERAILGEVHHMGGRATHPLPPSREPVGRGISDAPSLCGVMP